MITETKRWYEYDKSELHKGVSAEVDRIRRQQSRQRDDMIHWMRLYAAGNVSGLGLEGDPRAELERYMYGEPGSTRFNLAGAIVDTAESMCAQTPAVPVLLTRSGDFGLMRKARKKTQVLQGQMNELGAPVAKRIFRDAAKVGTGFAHAYIDDDGLPAVERVHPLEMLVEHADGLYGKPRSMHRWKLVSREELIARFPAKRWDIENAPGPSSDAATEFFLRMTEHADVIEVYESYHLASRTGKRDGLHCITIRNATLWHEKTDDTEHWFTRVCYRERDFGYFGSGLVESCESAQNRVNELISRVSRGQDIGSNLVILNPYLPGSTPVKPEKLTNELGLVINFDATSGAPTLAKWDGTQWDLQQQIDTEFERALLIEGLSAQQANGEGAGKGLTSGVAVRAADDVQTRRLVSPIERFQEACIGIAKMIDRLNDKLASRDSGYEAKGSVQQGRSTFLLTSRWADLAIPKGHAQISMMPMSALPTTPQGKWAAVMEWIEAGWVSQQYAMQLLQFPDLDSYADQELAHLDLAQWQVEKLLDAEDVWPVPRQNLQVAIDIATKSELKAMTLSADDDVIDAFERFITRCEEMMEQAAKAAQQKQMADQAQMQPPPGPPGAPPGPAPGPPPAPGPQGPGQLVQAPPMAPPMSQVV